MFWDLLAPVDEQVYGDAPIPETCPDYSLIPCRTQPALSRVRDVAGTPPVMAARLQRKEDSVQQKIHISTMRCLHKLLPG